MTTPTSAAQTPPRDNCRSGRAWEIGEGHLPSIREARIRSLDEIERREGELVEARQELIAAQDQFAIALRARNAAAVAVEKAEERLRSARRQAVYRLSSSSDISRPADKRGAEHDLDDVLLDEVPRG